VASQVGETDCFSSARAVARRTASAMSWIGSCVQNRRTVHPASRRAALFRSSRATFALSLARHQRPFALGVDPCSGQTCQKHPSTKTQIRRGVKRMSGRQRRPVIGAACLRKRRPVLCSTERSSLSAALSERFPSMTFRECCEEAGGAGGTFGTSNLAVFWSAVTLVLELGDTSDAVSQTNHAHVILTSRRSETARRVAYAFRDREPLGPSVQARELSGVPR
jgi:hypothetical protein